MGKERIEQMKLLLALLSLQFCFVGFHIVFRVALNIGVSKVVYPVYRNIIALIPLSPFAYFLEKKERSSLTFSLLVQFFLLALIGITANQGFYIMGLYYANPTFASAMPNSVPAITSIMACTLRMEQVSITRRQGMAKILGTIASVGGATVISLYKGRPLLPTPIRGNANRKRWEFKFYGIPELDTVLSILGWSLLIMGRLDGIPRPGIVSSGIVISLQTWCIHKGGPVFVAIFQPVRTVLVAIMACVILGDRLYSGGIIGTLFIVLRLYWVLWGKTREESVSNQDKEEDRVLRKHLDSESKHKELVVSPDIP